MFDANVQNLLAPSYSDPDLAVITHFSGTYLGLGFLTHPSGAKALESLQTPLPLRAHPPHFALRASCPTTRSSSFPPLSPGGRCQFFFRIFFPLQGHSSYSITITQPHNLY